MQRIIHYLTGDGTIVGKTQAVTYIDAPSDGRSFVEYAGNDWVSIGAKTHKVDVATTTVVPLTAAEIATRNAPAAYEVDALISRELGASDKTQLPDYPAAKSAGWATYRQALRNLSKIAAPTAANMLAAFPARPDGIDAAAPLKNRLPA